MFASILVENEDIKARTIVYLDMVVCVSECELENGQKIIHIHLRNGGMVTAPMTLEDYEEMAKEAFEEHGATYH